MKLQYIFDQLTTGPLSQLSIGGLDQGVIGEENYSQVLNFITLGLTALHRRFNLKEGRLLLALNPDQDEYTLTSEFAVSSRKSRAPVRYILDTVGSPFKDDVLKVESVKTANGIELVLNDKTDPLSVLTPSTKKLLVPMAIVNQSPTLDARLRTTTLLVSYRANHNPITIPMGYFDPARVEVELPDAYLEALLYFVASCAHTPRGMTTETQVGNVWLGMYEAECARLVDQNLQTDRGTANHRLIRGGWV